MYKTTRSIYGAFHSSVYYVRFDYFAIMNLNYSKPIALINVWVLVMLVAYNPITLNSYLINELREGGEVADRVVKHWPLDDLHCQPILSMSYD